MVRRITIQYVPGCPNVVLARRRVEAALRQLGRHAPAIEVEEIAGPEEAARRRFFGSPAVLYDGVDPFATPSSAPAFCCRTYDTETGRDVAPSVTQLLAALGRGREG